MPEQWHVLKFGGTSVDDASHWATIAGLATERVQQSDRVVLVCSALAGTTNALQAMAEPDNAAPQLLDALLLQHERLASSLGIDAADILEQGRSQINKALDDHLREPHPSRLAALMAQGEWLSTRIGQRYLSGRMAADWVDAAEALQTLPEDPPDTPRAWLSARCAAVADPGLEERWRQLAPVLITQGYVARRPDGGLAVLGRGGSDTSAALLACRLSAPAVEIWTDVPGLFSADPLQEPSARLLQALDYAEALEMAASGARVVHPRCIHVAAECGIPIHIRDIGRPGLQGTRIDGSDPVAGAGQGVKAVTRQDGILVLLLENLDTRQQVGFLAGVFAEISALGISVDLVATSETTTTLAINTVDNHLDRPAIAALEERLAGRCRVRLFPDSTCVNLVGAGVRTVLGNLGQSAGSFRDWPLLMLSMSANDMCLSFLVHKGHAGELLHALHEQVVVGGANGSHPVFGPEWRALSA